MPVALTHGPWLMQVTDRSAKFWFRANGDTGVTVTTNVGASASAVVGGSSDWCGYVTVEGLPADTEITWSMAAYDGTPLYGPATFRTMPTEGQPGVFDVYMLSDHHLGTIGNSWAQIGYQALLKLVQAREGIPKLCVQGGDFELHASTLIAQRRSDHQTIRDFWPEIKQFHAKVPLCGHVWDDQDFVSNNSFGKNYSAATLGGMIQVFREYFGGIAQGPAADAIYAAFRIADCLFVMTDNRSQRDGCPASAPSVLPPTYDYRYARCWGVTQLQWIKDTLLQYQDAPFKFVFTGTTVMDMEQFSATPPNTGPSAKRDSIGLFYRYERNDLLLWLRDNPKCARGLIFLSGDDHRMVLQRSSYWHDPCPWTQLSALSSPVNYGWPLIPDFKIPSLTQNATGLTLGGTEGGQSRVEQENRAENQLVIMRVNTAKKHPSLGVQIISIARGDPVSIYRWETTADWYLPQKDTRPIAQTYRYRMAEDPGGLFASNGSLQRVTMNPEWRGDFSALDLTKKPKGFEASIQIYNAFPSNSILSYFMERLPNGGSTYRISWWQYSPPNCPVGVSFTSGRDGDATIYWGAAVEDILVNTWQKWEVDFAVGYGAFIRTSAFQFYRSDNTPASSWVTGLRSELVSAWTPKVPI